ncbi:BMP family ABC transporter substrate-binding protein [Pseudoflavonifractor phocaeensis]|uniref:BMP family ABC transporter substrate-binding protein n=1 Tax=Pseudoflavonifractor phocaeensis TaxID=1870988 RepID=UPI001F313C8D|nr:BMP family ABC transporter substrate-binding protein [Pseudoflavonifractor phocaeensis]MCF2596264.1 BMP family ABC transporter substrate-binding protein [Pseudoflavonifractor phocaeensis]MDY3905774.1 BMP family ABC transporter substrate-binding protein [Lawsonibacter sp.]
MKKILAMVMAMAMVLSLAACGGGDKPSTSAGSAASGAASSGAAGTSDAADFKVGAIYINSKNDTAGYTYAHHHGITTAMEELGMDPATQLVIQDEIPEDEQQVLTAIDTLVGEGANIIFGISFGYIDAMEKAAAEYPDVVFSHATGYKCNDTNFNNYFGRAYQARYLAGIAAGLKSLETGNNNIGYVAAYGTEYAETCSGINGFALGAQSVNPDAKVYVKKLGAWADEVNESAFAKELIDSYKCGVISQHCDSAQPQIAAQDAGVFGCGYNSDMTADAPNAHLTAAIWNWNVYYRTAIEAAMTCGDASNYVSTLGSGAWYGGLKEGFVDVSPLNEATCAAGTQEAIDAVKELIISGEWDVFSGVKLHITVADGAATVEKADEALVDNTGAEIVAAGGPSVEDSVITGTMNYFVAGVEEA